MKLLLTAFVPFGADAENSSQEALRACLQLLKQTPVPNLTVESVLLPVTFAGACDAAMQKVQEFQPDAVLCLGQAGGREQITLERIGINLCDCTLPDNDGACPADTPLVPGGPAAYFSTLPIKTIAACIQKQGIACGISNTAGTYVCNSLLYGLLHRLPPSVRCGFMHIPNLPGQAPGRPFMTAQQAGKAVYLACVACGNL